MIPLYLTAVAAVAAVRWLVSARAGRLDRKYARAADAAGQAAKLFHTRPGNASAADPLLAAKRQYELGRLVQLRDALEGKYLRWQGHADRVGRLLGLMLGWKGRLVPYLFGIADVALALAALNHLGFQHGLTPDGVKSFVQAYARR